VSAHWACSPVGYRVHRLVPDLPPGVLRACCGALLSPVTAQVSDRPCGSLVCPACAEHAAGPIPGWPLVEVPPTPGGQPVPSPARQGTAAAVAGPPPRFPPPGRHSAAGIPAPVLGDRPCPCREPEAAAPGWGSCPAERQLHLRDPAAIGEAAVVGWAKVRCGRLIFAANLTLRGGSAQRPSATRAGAVMVALPGPVVGPAHGGFPACGDDPPDPVPPPTKTLKAPHCGWSSSPRCDYRTGPFLHRCVARSGFEETRRPLPRCYPSSVVGPPGKNTLSRKETTMILCPQGSPGATGVEVG
jgi:hypothetical protein